jgi:hypothetical protein
MIQMVNPKDRGAAEDLDRATQALKYDIYSLPLSRHLPCSLYIQIDNTVISAGH